MKAEFLKLHYLNKLIPDYILCLINDKIQRFFTDEFTKLNFFHVYDKQNILKKEVNEHNIKGYIFIKKSFSFDILVLIKCENKFKTRETALELISHFKLVFEKLGFYLGEYGSNTDNSFYLLTYLNKTYLPLKALCRGNYVYLRFTNLLPLFLENLPTIFNPYRFGFIIQNNNRSEMLKEKRELLALNGLYLNNRTFNENVDNAFKNYLYLIVTSSLTLHKNQEYRVTLLKENNKVELINVYKFDDYLTLQNKKIAHLNYQQNMVDTLNYTRSNLVRNCYLCSNCIRKNKGNYLLKYLNQTEEKNCYSCKKNLGEKYLLISKKDSN